MVLRQDGEDDRRGTCGQVVEDPEGQRPGHEGEDDGRENGRDAS